MELYYTIAVLDRDKSNDLTALLHETGIPAVMTLYGRGTATREHLLLSGLEAKGKAILCGVADAAQAKQLFKLARRRLQIDIPGNGIIMNIPLKSVAGGRTLAYLTDSAVKEGRPNMNFQHELIIVIMNEGYSDFVMDAARSAGAGGGTVLHAKGTAGGRDQSFYGVNLAEEKDMVYIVAYADQKAAIMRAISEKAGPGTKAGAICFSLPISSVIGLRARESE